jgi:hypothetical protein
MRAIGRPALSRPLPTARITAMRLSRPRLPA